MSGDRLKLFRQLLTEYNDLASQARTKLGSGYTQIENWATADRFKFSTELLRLVNEDYAREENERQRCLEAKKSG